MPKIKKIIISGEIGWEVMPADIRRQLSFANGADLDIDLSSPGGSVIRGIEIYNMFRDYKKTFPKSQIIMTIKGIAASMASYLISNPAIDLRVAEDNAVFMIHNAWGYSVGDYRDMLKTAEVFEGWTNTIAQAYEKITGKELSEIRTMMDEETWFFGKEILTAGFVDEIADSDGPKKETSKEKAILKAKSNFDIFAKKFKEKNEKTDFEQIAAMIKGEKREPEPAKPVSLEIIPGNKIIEPAPVATIQPEVIIMDLEQLLKENPAAKFKYDEDLKNQFNAGVLDATNKMQAKFDVASKYLTPDSTYGKAVKSAAIGVLKGEKSIDALEMLATVMDEMKESTNSTAAIDESTGLPAVEGNDPQITQDGNIKTEQDFQAECERFKAVNGMGV